MNIKLYLATTAVLLSAVVASADTVRVDLAQSQGQSFTANETSSVDFGFTNKPYQAGMFYINDDGVNGTDNLTFLDKARKSNGTFTPGNNNIVAFCIDLAENVGGNTRYFVASSLTDAPITSGGDANTKMNSLRATAVKQLWYQELSTGSTYGATVTGLGNFAINSIASAAIQMALHEIVFERDSAGYGNGGWNVNTGSYQIVSTTAHSNAAEILANKMLAALTATDKQANLVALIAPKTGINPAQDLLIEFVPAPGSVVGLLGLGAMLGLSVVRRRRSVA